MLRNLLIFFSLIILGSVIDVAKLLDQLKRSEKARSDTESQLKSTQKSLSDLQHAADKHASVKEKLQVISRKNKYFFMEFYPQTKFREIN